MGGHDGGIGDVQWRAIGWWNSGEPRSSPATALRSIPAFDAGRIVWVADDAGTTDVGVVDIPR